MQKKILILDDDDDLLEIIDLLLSDSGYSTLTVNKGNLINEIILAYRPDLILMDVMLGNMDGRLICQHIKASENYAMPVILFSGSHNLGQVMHQTGPPDDFIAKPFDVDDLLKRIEVLI